MNLIDSDENVIKNYEISTSETFKEICLTDKRLYYSQDKYKTTQDAIIEIRSINSIQNTVITKEKSYIGLTLLALLLLGAGIALIISLHHIAFLALSIIGIILFIVAAILSAPKYHTILIIGSNGIAHEIEIEQFNPRDIDELQKLIFQTKEHLL